MKREARKYIESLLEKYGVDELDVSYFGSYACGYFDSRFNESMTEEEYNALWDEAHQAAQKYLKMLEKGEK